MPERGSGRVEVAMANIQLTYLYIAQAHSILLFQYTPAHATKSFQDFKSIEAAMQGSATSSFLTPQNICA